MKSAEEKPTVKQMIVESMMASGKTPASVANEIGANPAIISMIAVGANKLPFALIQPLASALGVDDKTLLRTALEEYAPELIAVMESVLHRKLFN